MKRYLVYVSFPNDRRVFSRIIKASSPKEARQIAEKGDAYVKGPVRVYKKGEVIQMG